MDLKTLWAILANQPLSIAAWPEKCALDLKGSIIIIISRSKWIHQCGLFSEEALGYISYNWLLRLLFVAFASPPPCRSRSPSLNRSNCWRRGWHPCARNKGSFLDIPSWILNADGRCHSMARSSMKAFCLTPSISTSGAKKSWKARGTPRPAMLLHNTASPKPMPPKADVVFSFVDIISPFINEDQARVLSLKILIWSIYSFIQLCRYALTFPMGIWWSIWTGDHGPQLRLLLALGEHYWFCGGPARTEICEGQGQFVITKACTIAITIKIIMVIMTITRRHLDHCCLFVHHITTIITNR